MIPEFHFLFQGPSIVRAGSLGHLNRTQPLLTLIERCYFTTASSQNICREKILSGHLVTGTGTVSYFE